MRAPLMLLLILLGVLVPVTFASAATRTGYRSTCGVELGRDVAGPAGGPVCGTDEGDDVGFAGEDAPVRFFGENGHDTVAGSRSDDTFMGGAGNDEIHGGRGDDRIDGGDDSDTLFGGLGADVVVERRFGVRERFFGGPGDDVLGGGRGGDELHGDPGDDVLFGGSGSDRLYGGAGDDVLYGGPNRDVFDCGPGVDTVYRVRRMPSGGRSSTDRRDAYIPRAAGCERVLDEDPTAAFALRDLLGGGGADLLVGTGGRELLQGKGGADRLFGGGGDDELEGDGVENQGADLLMGGSGADRLAGRAGDDRLYGDARSATAGPPGNDELAGGAGRDLLAGGPGGDLLLGAYDGDRILAGAGNDVVSLLGGDARDPEGRVEVNCGPGRDLVIVNPDRRGDYRGCESFAEQFHEADYGYRFRPSPESFPPGFERLAFRPTAAQAVPVGPEGAPTGTPVPTAAPPRAPAPGPADAAGGASAPSISADGGRLAFSSDAPNLVADDANGRRTDPFVRDVPRARTLLAALSRRGQTAERGGRLRRGPAGAISADGRFVAFSSNSPDLTGRLPAHAILRHDLARRTTQRACRAGGDDSENPAISAGGQHVAFESRATDLAGPDRNRHTDVYWCDIGTGELRRVSRPLRDEPSRSGSSLDPSLSADGRYVAFTSDAGGLVAGDATRAGVYWRDIATGETRLVDVPAGATSSDGNGQNPKISPDGRFVVFDSDATDLPGGGANGRTVDVFRRDMLDGTVLLVSQGAGGEPAAGDSTADSLSGDSGLVAFTSNAPNLLPGDANGRADVFVRDLGAGTTTRASAREDGQGWSGPSGAGALSADGRFVALVTRAPDALAGVPATPRPRVVRKDRATGALEPGAPGVDLPPRSLLAGPAGSVPRRRARLVFGTARDDARVSSVEVSLTLQAGGGRCRALTRGARLVDRRCDEPLHLPARLTGGLRFTVRIGRLLPRGRYVVRSRARDAAGQVEPERAGRNVVEFRLE